MNFDPDDRPRFHDYQDSFVAFLDLLGFSEAVRSINTDEDFDQLGLLLFALKKEAEAYSAADGHLAGVVATAVSDSIVFTVPFTEPAAGYSFVAMLHHLQYTLIATFQAPLRGFVSRGPVYHRDGILFGTGYMDAYHGEESTKGPPGIVIDSRGTNEVDMRDLDRIEQPDGCAFGPSACSAVVHLVHERNAIAGGALPTDPTVHANAIIKGTNTVRDQQGLPPRTQEDTDCGGGRRCFPYDTTGDGVGDIFEDWDFVNNDITNIQCR